MQDASTEIRLQKSPVTADESTGCGVSEKQSDCSVLFVNWYVEDDSIPRADLFDGFELQIAAGNIVFFDPLGFAAANGMRRNSSDIAEAEYQSISESDFRRYLAGVKRATQLFQSLLDGGGILVLRSQFPNTQLRIRKKSSVGTQTYTESVVSPFFWMEDFLGKFSFPYASKSTIEFVDRHNPLRKLLGHAPVNCLQTLNTIGKGEIEIIATTASAPKSPAIAKISPENSRGQIYIIPQFLVRREHAILVDAFKSILLNKSFGMAKPAWLDDFAERLGIINPYRAKLEELGKQIDKLEQERDELLQKLEETMRLVDLLVETGEDLQSAARVGLETVGFDCSENAPGRQSNSILVVDKGNVIRRAIVRIAANDSGPIRVQEIRELQQAIDSSNLKNKPKGILIGNASRMTPPKDRQIWFDMECQTEAKQSDICLIPSFEFYAAACFCLAKAESDIYDTVRSAVRRDIMECDAVFQLNRKRFGVRI